MLLGTTLRSIGTGARGVTAQSVRASALGLTVIAILFVHTHSARAQFSKPVIVLKGTVRSEDNGKPTSVHVSVRTVGDTAREITSSTSNSLTGKYLVVLEPGRSYWVHFEGDSILTKDVMITMPHADRTQQVEQDFTVVLREAPVTPAMQKETTN